MPTRNDRTVPRRRTAADAGVHINFITSATLQADGRMRLTTRGTPDAEELTRLDGPAGRQLMAGLLQQLHVHGGTWTSSYTVSKLHYACRRFLRWLGDEAGLDDLTDEGFTPALAWRGVVAVSTAGGLQRNFRTFLADVLPAVREDGEQFRSLLLGRALPVDVHRLEGYAPEVADAIELVARDRVGAWYQRHRAAVSQALGGELPKDWMRLSSQQLLGGQAVAGCPQQFCVSPDELGSAMVLLALIDDKGPNLSVIQSHTASSFERSGEDASFSTAVKARNRQVLRTPAPAGGLFSYGGLLEFVTSATRVCRHLRDDGSDFARLLFVPCGGRRVLDGPAATAWWYSTGPIWPDLDLPRPTSLTFPRLRKAAKLRGKPHGRILVGQGQRTARLYMADAVPDVILIPGLIDTQTSVTSHWRDPARWDSSTAAAPGVDHEHLSGLLAAPAVMDVGVAVCSSNGQSPTDTAKPCGLGPVACFVCPNGYRIPEVIPGLLAARQFTDNIRRFEPTEWLAGEAPVLHELAGKALDQFPRPMVEAVRREDVDNARALIACIYHEGRRRD